MVELINALDMHSYASSLLERQRTDGERLAQPRSLIGGVDQSPVD